MQQYLLHTNNLNVVDDRCIELFDNCHCAVNVINVGDSTRDNATAVDRQDFQAGKRQLVGQDAFDFASIRGHRDVDRVKLVVGVPKIQLSRPRCLRKDLNLVLRNWRCNKNSLVVNLEFWNSFFQRQDPAAFDKHLDTLDRL